MSRYSGPQQRGAERQARVEKRREAEHRQATERERDARRRAEDATWQDEPELNGAELDSLLRAVAAVRLAESAGIFGRQPRRARKPLNGESR